jgi:hypothetical protein
MDYDGIDIDYENLPATDRVVFSSFIENLATALHAQGKSLSVDVYAKTFEPGYWNGPQSEDWTRIGSAADEVRIMMYGYSWQTSIPGPIAPISWVNEVLAFAKTVIPASKIIHGLPGYGIDWPSGSAGTEFMWDDLNARVTNFGATLNWDLTSMSPWFQYVSSGKAHTVWFENAASTAAKISSTSNYDVGGVFVWRLGGEDPQIWNSIRTEFNGTIPPAVPTVTIKAGGQDADITISYNTSTTISWSSANADNCTVAPTGWVGLSSTGISTGNLTSTTTYTVSCVGGGATAADSIKINVTPQITADTTAPTVSITDPLAGSLLNKKARIVVIASDNVKVTKVQIYTDSSLLATVTTAPYVTTWNTARVTPGSHVVRAVAYDASGNNAATQITVSAR